MVVYPGSFDPFTLGHLNIVQRAQKLFGDVTIIVAHNSLKVPWLDIEQRAQAIRDAVGDGVNVEAWSGLLAERVQALGANAIVKGLRGGADLDMEYPMALMNKHLAGIDTVFLTTDPEYTHISSTMVRDVAAHGGDIADLVPPSVLALIQQKLSQK